MFRLWDPSGVGEIPEDKLLRLVQNLWSQFTHQEAFERATKALRIHEIGDGSVHCQEDLRRFLQSVAYCGN